MKNLKIILGTFLLLLVSTTLIACKKEAKIEFKDEEITIFIDEEKELDYEVTKGFEVNFRVSNGEIIKVEDGKVIGLRVGEAQVIAEVEGEDREARLLVKVEKDPDVIIDTDYIVILGQSKGYVGEVIEFTYRTDPRDATNQDVVWSVSDEEYAKIDENGKVELLKEGEVTIIVTQEDIESSFTIEITPFVELEDIEIEGKNEGVIGDVIELKVTFNPEDASIKDVTWSVSDKEYAKIDEEGNVELLKEGKVTIKTKVGEVEKEFEITISKEDK